MAFCLGHHRCHPFGTAVNRFHLSNALLKPLFVVEPFGSARRLSWPWQAHDRDHPPGTLRLKTRMISPSCEKVRDSQWNSIASCLSETPTLTQSQLRAMNYFILHGAVVQAPPRKTKFLRDMIVRTQWRGKRVHEPGVAKVATISSV